ncbi:MAG: hypothetical protein ACE5RH_02680 [Nitrosarchaeum sp.]
MIEFLKMLLGKIDNDTLIIIGLVGIAFTYALINSQDGAQIVSNIVAGFVGYLGGQYVTTKKE